MFTFYGRTSHQQRVFILKLLHDYGIGTKTKVTDSFQVPQTAVAQKIDSHVIQAYQQAWDNQRSYALREKFFSLLFFLIQETGYEKSGTLNE